VVFVEYPLHIGGREGLIAGAIVLVLLLIVLRVASTLLLLWETEASRVSNDPA